ncbi:hypothetical protein JCM11251_002721 [Rhodosporidiobolus azoricus]
MSASSSGTALPLPPPPHSQSMPDLSSLSLSHSPLHSPISLSTSGSDVDDADDLDALHPPHSPTLSPPSSLAPPQSLPPPVPTLSQRTSSNGIQNGRGGGAAQGVKPRLSTEALRIHQEALVRRISGGGGGRLSSGGAGTDAGGVVGRDYASPLPLRSPLPSPSRSPARPPFSPAPSHRAVPNQGPDEEEEEDEDEGSLGGSIHSAPEFAAPPSPARLQGRGVRFSGSTVPIRAEEGVLGGEGGGGEAQEGEKHGEEEEDDDSGSVIDASSPTMSSPVTSRRDSMDLRSEEDGEDEEEEEAEHSLEDEAGRRGDRVGMERAKGGQRRRRRDRLQRLPSTLWDYLLEEVLSVEVDGEEGIKSERVTNFLTVPKELEKIIIFGVFICLDSFLYTFTILPLRSLTALFTLLSNTLHNTLLFLRLKPSGTPKRRLRLSHKCDLSKAAILAGTLWMLHRVTDASKMYHGVRGQETIKLYVLFNVLEIADRLCCSFGQDLQDSLFSRQTLGRRTDGSHPRIRPVALFGLNMAYVVAHSLVLFYQLVTLNVAINSYSNALLTLLLSNQFVEIKGSVFKKFEKENLFQLTCADIVERFQLGLMLFIIALRNLIELSSAVAFSTTTSPSSASSSSSYLLSFLPASFRSLPSLTFSTLSSLPTALPLLVSSLLPTLSLLQAIFSPAVVVLCSECFVDWLKHAFITKFNHIRPGVYGRFVDVLCKDLVAGKRDAEPFVDQSPTVARRLGFAALPLGCLVVRVISQAFEMLADDSGVDECAPAPVRGALGLGLGVSGRYAGPGAGGGGEDWVSWVGGWAVVVAGVAVVWVCLVALKLLIGINLRAFASHRWSTMLTREAEEQLADRGREKIGVSTKEAELDAHTTALLADEGLFDATAKRKAKGLLGIGRYDMIKSRLW